MTEQDTNMVQTESEAVGGLAADVAEEGIVDLMEAADTLDAASDAADVAVAAGAAAVEDITRAEDTAVGCQRCG